MSSQQDLSYLADLSGRLFRLEPNKEFTIGRALSNSLTIEDLKISRTHCRLKDLTGLWSIIDESANGIYVNEKRAPRNEPLVLSNGDRIKLTDQIQFRFVEAKSAVATDMEMSDVVDQIETEHQYNTAPSEPVAGPVKSTETTAMDVGEGSGTSRAHADVETELQCSICTELFVKAHTLNCSHTFCATCIDEWKRKNKICPICRARIKTITPTIVLDNLVNTVIQSSSDEIKQSRKLLLEERSKATEKTAAKRRKQRGPQTRNRAANVRRNVAPSEPVFISSDSETESDEDDNLSPHGSLSEFEAIFDDDDIDGYNVDDYSDAGLYMPGDSQAYYGGYGSCFRCGARGHWANGCPLR